MTKSHQFSIVIPTYNRLKFLQQALDTVWAQTHDDYEIIVVDDGSTDGTWDYLASLECRVKRVRQSNRGPAAARNMGVRLAEGEYVAFLDSDDFWLPWTLATIDKVIQQHNQPSLISAATSECEGEAPNLAQENFATEWFCNYFATADRADYVGSGALFVKRSVFNHANGFDEGMSVGEDLDFYFRLGTVCSFVRVLSPVTLGYRRHAENMSRVSKAAHCAAVELLKREAEDRYPGGKAYQKQRWKLLSRGVRPVVLGSLRAGLYDEAWQLYRQSFVMNVRLGRLRFLLGFALNSVLLLRQ
jgi:glycosyltransferase involved in cell wall biosynthesis